MLPLHSLLLPNKIRIHLISALLKVNSVQNVADIIGHNEIRSTLKYSRYAMSNLNKTYPAR